MEDAPASNDPRALETAGAQTVTIEFHGGHITIPFPVEAWPLDDIAAHRNGRALKQLLNGQRPAMSTHADVIELSHRMADACGLVPLPHTPASPRAMFGGAPALTTALNRPDDLEADLRRFYGIDYRDRWRGLLTLRQVWVCVRRLPHDAALLIAAETGDAPWTRGDIIAARSWEMFTREWYPGRPLSREERVQRQDKIAADQAEMDELARRETYYATGQNMRDAGVDPGPVSADPARPPQRRRPPNTAESALAQARQNAIAQQRKASTDGRAPRKPRRPYDPAGSGWG